MSLENEQKEWMYDAFISYRHIEPDSYVAGTLHKLLEAYKLPKNLAKDPETGKRLKRTKINKVFRDAEELPLTSNLSDTIENALANSEYLIAVCSPQYGESLWCKREIEKFIELRGVENILAVLVDGEPGEVFPEQLLYRDIKKIQDDGSIITVRDVVEPLAANARGKNNKERYKNLKVEALRLMAPMFGCSFDALKQRHREQKLRRTIRIVTIAASVCLIFGIVSGVMAFRIKNQNEQIVQQNEQIAQQAQRIEEQFNESLIYTADSLSEYAKNLLVKGDRTEAVNKALSVYPKGNDNLPYLAKTENVLTEALRLYDVTGVFRPDRIINANSAIRAIAESPDGQWLVMYDNSNTLSVANTDTGIVESSLFANRISVIDDYPIKFIDASHFCAQVDKNIVLYDLNTQSIVYSVPMEEDACIAYSAVSGKLFAVNGSEYIIISAADGNVIVRESLNSVEIREAFDADDSGYMSINASCAGVDVTTGKDMIVALSRIANDKNAVVVIDAETGKIKGINEIDCSYIANVVAYDGVMYVTADTVDFDRNVFLDNSYMSTGVYAIDLDSQALNWSKTYIGSVGDKMYVLQGGQSDYVALDTYGNITLYDKKTGEVYREFALGEEIVYTCTYADNEYISAFTRSGKWLYISPEMYEPLESGLLCGNQTNVALCAFARKPVVVEHLSKEAVVFSDQGAVDAQIISGDDSEYMNALADIKEVTDEEKELKSEYLESLGIQDSFVASSFLDDDKQYFGVSYWDGTLQIYKMSENGPLKDKCSTFENLDNTIKYIKFDDNHSYVALYSDFYGCILDLSGLKEEDEVFDESMICAQIDGFKGIDFESRNVYIYHSKQVYKVPFYSRQEIIEKAKERKIR